MEAPVVRTQFDHEKLDVYHVALEFAALADEVATELAAKRTGLADQLRRASTSIVLNVAEGAGEFKGAEKARFYRMAMRSATECAAVLDLCRVVHAFDEKGLLGGREMLLRIVAMLTRLVQVAGAATHVESGSGSGSEKRGEGTR
jgi:four helix bundle protein